MNIKNHKKLYVLVFAAAMFFFFSIDSYSRGGRGGGRGGRSGGRSSGRSFSRSSSRSRNIRRPGSNYGSIRHSSSFRTRGRSVRTTRTRGLVVAGHHNGRPYYRRLPRGYRRIRRGGVYYYVYDDEYYKRVYRNGEFIYILVDRD